MTVASEKQGATAGPERVAAERQTKVITGNGAAAWAAMLCRRNSSATRPRWIPNSPGCR